MTSTITMWHQIAHAPDADIYRVGDALIVGRERAEDSAIVQGVEQIAPATLGDLWIVYDPMRGGIVAQYATRAEAETYEQDDEVLAWLVKPKLDALAGRTVEEYCAQRRAQYRAFRGGYERIQEEV